MSRSTDEHIAAAMAAIKDESRRWSAMVEAQRTASRAADRRTCLLATALSAVLVLGAVAGCAMTAELALSGTLIAVPLFVAFLGLSASLSLAVAGAAMAYRSVGSSPAPPARLRFAVVMTGRSLFTATALATAASGVLVAVHGLPAAAALAAAVAIGVAVLGRKLAGVIQHAGRTEQEPS